MPQLIVKKNQLAAKPSRIAGIALGISAVFFAFTGGLIGWFSYSKAAESLQLEMEKRLAGITNFVKILCLDAWDPESHTFKNLPALQESLENLREKNQLENIFVFDKDLKSLVDSRPKIPQGKQYSMLQLEPHCVEGVFKGEERISGRRVDLDKNIYMSAYAAFDISKMTSAIYAETDISYLNPLKELKKMIILLGFSTFILALIHLLLLRKQLGALQLAHARANRWEQHSFASRIGAEVAHEIRNPLGIIKATIGALSRTYDRERRDERFDFISEEVDRLNKITTEISAGSDENLEKPQQVDLRQLTEQVVIDAQQDPTFSNITFELTLDPSAHSILADTGRLRQVILNLLLNARQAMDDNGPIKFWIGSQRFAGKDWVCMSIKDTGKGMSRKEMNSAFEPFYTTKLTGSGMGLSVVLKIIESYGGIIKLQSEKNMGTTIDLLFPPHR